MMEQQVIESWWKEKELQEVSSAKNPAKPVAFPMKRKRPAKLAIPVGGNLLALGCLEHKQEVLDNCNQEGSLFGISCKRGRRRVMEDAHKVVTNFGGNPTQAIFGVFDGHGGRKAAEFLAENLFEHIADAIRSDEDGQENLVTAVRKGYLTTDSEFLAKRLSSGACCVSALVRDGHLVVANAGDCKAVLSMSGKAEALTRYHRASSEDERKRIESLGGYVDCFNGVWRVQGVLAVTRGFGDMHLKQWISAEPEVKKLELTKDCEFLILASDGLWDRVSDQEAVDCARVALGGDNLSNKEYECNNGTRWSNGFAAACRQLVEMACQRGSMDDITVVLVPLQHFCKASNLVCP